MRDWTAPLSLSVFSLNWIKPNHNEEACPPSKARSHALDCSLDPINGLFQRVQFLLAGFPENGRITAVVIMAQHIAYTGNRPPWNAILSRLQFFRNAAAGLRQYLKISFNKLTSSSILPETIKIMIRYVGLDILDGFQHMIDIESWLFLHEKTDSASSRISSFTCKSRPSRVTRSTSCPS